MAIEDTDVRQAFAAQFGEKGTVGIIKRAAQPGPGEKLACPFRIICLDVDGEHFDWNALGIAAARPEILVDAFLQFARGREAGHAPVGAEIENQYASVEAGQVSGVRSSELAQRKILGERLGLRARGPAARAKKKGEA